VLAGRKIKQGIHSVASFAPMSSLLWCFASTTTAELGGGGAWLRFVRLGGI